MRLNWAKRLFGEGQGRRADREDYYNSVIQVRAGLQLRARQAHLRLQHRPGRLGAEGLRSRQAVPRAVPRQGAEQRRPAARGAGAAAEGREQPREVSPAVRRPRPRPRTTITLVAPRDRRRTRCCEAQERRRQRRLKRTTRRRSAASQACSSACVVSPCSASAPSAAASAPSRAPRTGPAAGQKSAAPGGLITTFPQGQYTGDVDDDFNSLKTLNLVTPILIAAGGALLVGGIATIAVDRTNKKKGKGFYAGKKRLEVTGLSARRPLPGGGAAGSFARSASSWIGALDFTHGRERRAGPFCELV